MQHYTDDEIIEIGKEWLNREYEHYPEFIDGFGVRDLSPVPTVTLTDPVDVQILGKAIEKHGYTAKTRTNSNGDVLIGACVAFEDDEDDIIYTFESNRTFALDSPLQHDEPPEDGRTKILATYLSVKHHLEHEG